MNLLNILNKNKTHTMDTSIYKNKKSKIYFSGLRRDIINLIDKGDNRILEVGCAKGNTGYALKKEGYAKEVIGIELMQEATKEAEKKLDRAIYGNIETITLDFEENYFDYIIAGDVLEHLYDPWKTIQKLKPFLKEDGFFIASIPTIRNFKILFNLILKGEWNYVDAGILDKTHMRFFTKKTTVKMFAENGFEIVEIVPNYDIITYLIPGKHINGKLINRLTFMLFEEFLTIKYIIKAKK
ncbi:Methyltransferase type 11 [groundwater metagenome]|uniref:Methyltransferase type 11 n=1 Tax=groundwater metagenome TaxID=717931 RepID=A0A098EG25_9ZZZZ